MSDSEPSPSDQLDQLFAAPGAAPVPPAPTVPPLVLPDPGAGSAAAQVRQAPQRTVVRFQDLLRKLTPVMWVTPTLLMLNVAYYGLMICRGVDPLQPQVPQLLEWGADYAPLTWNGQPWRLLSSVFVHSGILHLCLNMWALWSVGQLLERLVGNVGFLIIYFASGIAGSVASLWWNEDIVSVGASGAIFGLLGAFATFIWNRTDSFPPASLAQLRKSLAMCFGCNLLLGASIQGIDQAAHLGGLVCGLVCGWLLSQPLDQYNYQRRFKKNLVTGAIALLTLGTLVLQHPPPPPDLFLELVAYEEIVPKMIDKYNAAVVKVNAKEMTYEQLIELVRKEILPPWIEVREHIDNLKNIPSRRRELIHQIQSQLLVREESWKLMIDSVEGDQKHRFDEYKTKWKQANQLHKQLEEEPEPEKQREPEPDLKPK